MATVIKQAGATTVRRLATVPTLVATQIDPRDDLIAALAKERDALVAELAEARGALDRAAAATRDHTAAAVAAAREAALAEGHRAGIAAAEVDEAGRVAAIADGIAGETARLEERFASVDALAAGLARACLDRVFHRPEAMAAMVTAALARHLATLTDDAALAVRVSGADFADTAALDAAVREVGARATVAIDLDLPAGACRIAARLGKVDLDVPGQWAVLARLLDTAAAA